MREAWGHVRKFDIRNVLGRKGVQLLEVALRPHGVLTGDTQVPWVTIARTGCKRHPTVTNLSA